MALEAFGDSKIMNGQVTLWQVVAAYVFALAGGSISTSLRLGHKPLCALISFAAGTLLGVTLFAILPESLGDSPGWAVAIGAATGYALFFFISKYIHHVCPACAASHFDADATRHFSEIATALIVALAIHSTTDGLALGIQQEAPATDATKWSLFAALCIHKVPEGLALGSLLIGAGLRRSTALGWVAAVEATTLLGGVIGYFFLAKVSTFWLGLIMAHVGGGFFYLAAHAVLGELIRHGKALVLTSFSAGLALIGILNICLRMFAS
jgi:zinc and cadmium transporter